MTTRRRLSSSRRRTGAVTASSGGSLKKRGLGDKEQEGRGDRVNQRRYLPFPHSPCLPLSLSPHLSLPLPLSPSPAPIVSARYYRREGLWGVKQRCRKWTVGCDVRWVERGR